MDESRVPEILGRSQDNLGRKIGGASTDSSGSAAEAGKSESPYPKAELGMTRENPEKVFSETQTSASEEKRSRKLLLPRTPEPIRQYIKALLFSTLLIVVAMWISISVFWGALSHQRDFTDKLVCWFIDQDGSDFGQAMQASFQANIMAPTNSKLGWRIYEQGKSMTVQQISNGVVEEHAWVAVVVNKGATASLTSARENGNASYDPTTALSFFYALGRNEVGGGFYIIPYAEALIGQSLAIFSMSYTGAYLAAQSGNVTAMQALARAPQTISTPFAFNAIDLRPYSAPVAIGITIIGMIIVLIFGFIIAMAGDAVRKPMEPFLTYKSLMILRIVTPVILYIPLSFSYSMISLAFKVPFNAKFNHAAGFFGFWTYIFIGMGAMGFASEVSVTWLGPQLNPFFLMPWIIFNAVSVTVPIQLQPWFYKFGFGFPFYNMDQAVRTIIFDTRSHLGLNAGVLLAWIALSMVTLPLSVWFKHRKGLGAARVMGKNATGREIA